MELSSKDIERLEEAGNRLEEFAVIEDRVIRLRNVDGRCYFYSFAEKKCRIYGKRPVGCYLYPVVYLLNEGPIVDELCPKRQTISKHELESKGNILIRLLKTMEDERVQAQANSLMLVDSTEIELTQKKTTKKRMR